MNIVDLKNYVPNALSTSRAVLAPVVAVFAWMGEWETAFIILTLSMLTDWFDGFFAKKWNVPKSVRFPRLDPNCDFIMIVGAIAGLLWSGRIGWIAVSLMFAFGVAVQLAIFFPKKFGSIGKYSHGIAAFYYLGTIFTMVGIYAYWAYGPGAIHLLWIAIPLLIFAGYEKQHRLRDWLQGRS